jgi:hypothetical protein
VTKSIFDIPSDAAEDARLDAEGDADFVAGHTIPRDVVGDWLLSLPKARSVHTQSRLFHQTKKSVIRNQSIVGNGPI